MCMVAMDVVCGAGLAETNSTMLSYRNDRREYFGQLLGHRPCEDSELVQLVVRQVKHAIDMFPARQKRISLDNGSDAKHCEEVLALGVHKPGIRPT